MLLAAPALVVGGFVALIVRPYRVQSPSAPDPKVEAWNLAVDDPLPMQVTDGRRVGRKVVDALWLRVMDVPAALAARGYEEAGSVVMEIVDLIGPHGVLLYPSYPMPAPRHYRPMWPPINWVYTAIFNVTGQPAVSVPLFHGEDGLPLGVQLVGRRGFDARLMRTARWLAGKLR